MNSRTFSLAVVVSIAALFACEADELARRNITSSLPTEITFCARLDLNAARKSKQAESLVNAARQQFKLQIDAIGQFSSLDLHDVNCIWIGVVKDKEVLIVLEGFFNAEAILNSPIVTNSKRLVKPGTIIAIETKDEKTNEPSHAVLINATVIAFGLPQLVDHFVGNYVNGRSGWSKNSAAVMENLAVSDAMLLAALMQIPENEIKQKPFLASIVNAQVEMNIQEQVTATAKMAMRDEEKATALRDLISGFVNLGLTSEIKVGDPVTLKAILDGLKLGLEGKTVTLSSTIDLELLKKLLRATGLVLN